MKHKMLGMIVGAALSFLLIGTVSASAIEYGWPTDDHTITQNFKLYTTSNQYRHWGLDIGVNGKTVYASAEGTVVTVYTGCTNYSGLGAGISCKARGGCSPNHDYYKNGYCNDSFGNGVIIRHSDGSYSSYAHLGTVSVKKDDHVTKGQPIGVSGSSGYSAGPHLHFTILRASKLLYWGACNENYVVDPLPLLNGEKIDEGPNANVTTGNADTVTETGAILRGSFTTAGKRATECGMYLGTDQNNLTRLGSDKVNTFGTSMFYSTEKYGRPLEPGTTYYYQAYVAVGSSVWKGSVKSFTTPGEARNISLSVIPDTLTIKDDRAPAYLSVFTEADGGRVIWSSSDPSIAYVYSSSGKVIGMAPGTAVITAEMEYNGAVYFADCEVTVLPRESNPGISLTSDNITVEKNAFVWLNAATKPSGEHVDWTSSNPDIASVDESGCVTGISAGTAIISASFEYNGSEYTDVCVVTVEEAQEPIKVPVLSLSVSQIKEGEGVTASWTAAAKDASYYISYSGAAEDGSYPFGFSGNTSSLSMTLGDSWVPGTYTLYVVASNSTGSVRSNEVKLVVQKREATRVGVVVNTNGQYLAINDRAAASPTYSNQIGRIPPGGAVIVYPDKTSGSWYYVEYNGVSGYVYSKYLSLL